MFDKILQEDTRCLSVLTKLNVRTYLNFVDSVYRENGGIAGQRAPLKTKTAITIRRRMISDIGQGAVLPPVVIGIHANADEWQNFVSVSDNNELLSLIGEPHLGRVSIIDGMQRTTAIIDAADSYSSVYEQDIRVEYWISDSLNNLIYRMLVLNTGQVPWDMSRQLRTIYSPLISIILDRLETLPSSIEVFDANKEVRRRTRAGQYKAENLIQLLLHFSSGKYDLELKDKIAEDFARLDLIESSSHEVFLDYFVEVIMIMTILDEVFSSCEIHISEEDFFFKESKFNSGASIFKSFPAQVGFCVAVSNLLFDDPGFEIDWGDADVKFDSFKKRMYSLIIKLIEMDNDTLINFLELEVLDELMSVKKSQVGRFERSFFTEAFSVLISKTDKLVNMAPCWRKA